MTTIDWTDTALPSPHTLVLFGATGDLSKRKLLPALYSLHRTGLLPSPVRIVGVARTKMSDDAFRDLLRESIDRFARHDVEDEGDWRLFANLFTYIDVDINNAEDFRRLYAHVTELEKQTGVHNRMFYLALAPNFFVQVVLSLKASGLTDTEGFKRLITEKPFGHNYQSAAELNHQLRQVFEEEEIYRIDHYLGKEMVQNIEVIRFANSIFEPVWNNRSIANVQITSSETVGVEDRAGYYDKAGALRDMVQNHMLQMAMMIAMEPPSRLKTEAIRDEKVKVLRSLRRITIDDAPSCVVRGQYDAGIIGGKEVPAYVDEPGVSPQSQTETFVAARLHVDNFRWAGVPFYIRTGKRMAHKSTEIVIQFRDMPKNLYFNQDGNLGPNLLGIRVNPHEGIYIRLNAKHPGPEGDVVPIAMEFSHEEDNSPEAYERLLYDGMRGDSTFFTRWDEVSLAWKLIDPIEEAFRQNVTPLEKYRAGSWGPAGSDKLLRADGFRWWPVHGQDVHGQETPSAGSHLQKVDSDWIGVK
jgi:glucose-6-phosphate 1-dehydrogenase